MIIRELRLTNFGIYSGEHVLSFSPRMHSKKNITLIGGMNGRGKTTMLDAILLALYGSHASTVRESGMSYTAYLKRYINKNSSDNSASIELTLDVPFNGEVIEIRLKRAWSGNKNKVADKLKVWRGLYLDDHLAKHWDIFVEELIPLGISGLFFFDGEKISRLAEEEETSETMQQAIKAMLGIDVIDRLLIDMERIVKRKQNEVSNLQNNQEISDLESELKDIVLALREKEQTQSKLNTDIERLSGKLQQREMDFIKLGGNLIESHTALLIEKEKLVKEIALIKAELVNLAGGFLPLLLVTPALSKITESINVEESVKSAKHVDSFFTELNNKFNNLSLPEKTKKQIIAVLSLEREKISCLQQQKLLYNLSPVGIQLIDNVLSKAKKGIEPDICTSLNRLTELETRLEYTETYLLTDLDKTTTDNLLKEIKEISRKIAGLETNLIRINGEISTLTNKKVITEGKLRKALLKNIEEQNAADDGQRIIKYAVKSQEIMEQFKTKVLETKVSHLGEKINECFNFVIGKRSLVSKVEINPCALKLTLYDNNNEVILKSELSAGEKQMLSISILWGLSQCSGRALPVVIDTPLGRLDSSHRTNFVTKYLPNASHQVIVLSTDEEIKDPYLELIDDYICNKYLLDYDDNRKATSVVEGYFQGNAV
jgi:DNA sulfur modification protein DndD